LRGIVAVVDVVADGDEVYVVAQVVAVERVVVTEDVEERGEGGLEVAEDEGSEGHRGGSRGRRGGGGGVGEVDGEIVSVEGRSAGV
jgi:hypothetical protein